MSRSPFGNHPFMLGFEQVERLIERAAKTSSDGYPPFNIEQTGENAFRITLAVAGFSEETLSIAIEDTQLVVRGRQSDDVEERMFLHRGIAARQFQRSFVLAEGIEVSGAALADGLLHIDLTRTEPETVVRTVEITRR